MRTIGWVLLVVVVVGLLLALPPATRDVIRVQLSALRPADPLYGFYPLPLVTEEPVASDQMLARLAARAQANSPQDWQALVGAGILASDEKRRLEYLQQALKLAPEEPVTLMALAKEQLRTLSWERREDYGYGAKPPEGFQEQLLSEGQAAPLRATLERLGRVDPENGAPLVLLAWLDLGQKHDAEALALLHEAAGKPKFSCYDLAQVRATLRALHAAGVPGFEATTMSYGGYLFPHFARIRSVARIVGYRGMEEAAAGNGRQAVEDWTSMVRVGRQMRYQSETLIGYLVGSAVEAIGAAPVYIWMRSDNPKVAAAVPASKEVTKAGRYNGGDIYQGQEFKLFLATAGSEATADILAGLEQSQQLKQLSNAVSAGGDEELLNPAFAANALMSPGILLLEEAAMLVALAVLLGLLPWGKKRELGLSKVWLVVLALIALAPTIIFIGDRAFHLSKFGAETMGSTSSLLDSLPINPMLLLLSLPALLLVCCASAALELYLQQEGKASFGGGLLRLLRPAVALSLVLVVLGYGGLTIQTARLRERTTTALMKQIAGGELAGLQRSHPQLFAPPKL